MRIIPLLFKTAPHGATINMCGISGTVNNHDGGKVAAAMGAIIKHRGPDEGPNVLSNIDISSAAVRLSIVDVQNGSQPMVDSVGNIISQNGEIYNYLELKHDLEKQGYVFKTNCDTEVLMAGFSKHGPNFVKKLDGIFAISFYDIRSRTTFLFRDYFGIKPLYYRKNGKIVEFSSEIKSFWHNGNQFEIDFDYLIYNHVFNWSNPEASLYKGIHPVLPGTYLEISKSGQTKEIRYQPDGYHRRYQSFDEACTATRTNLVNAVRSQIPNEVNWGVLLSGGVDSSILAWIARGSKDNPINTYSVCSADIESEDLINAREIAKFLGTNHKEIRIETKDAIDNYGDYLYSIEDINSRFFFYYFISRYLEGKVKVALCGEGADELYMGYPVYRNLEQFVSESESRWCKVKHLTSKYELIEKTLDELKTMKTESLYHIMINKQLPWFQLNPVDKCSMRFGVELRVPYLSLKHALPVINYPASIKLSGDIEKQVLRTAFKDTNLPTINRKKFFAGTRTLPSFYQQLDTLATKNHPTLKKKYKSESLVLDSKGLYALSLLDQKMRDNSHRDTLTASIINK